MDDDIANYDYELPPQLIAQRPPKVRDGGKLLALCGQKPVLHHIVDLPSLLQAGDLLVVNNSRVLPARLCGQTANGGRVEVLAERFLDDGSVLAQVKAANAPKPNAHLVLAGGDFIVKRRAGEFFILFAVDGFARQRFLRYGQIPLPPYIRRTPDDQDKARYQTVFAYRNGSVAAPTAGLHFTSSLLAAVAAQGVRLATVTLHVGAGTFKPLRMGLRTASLHREKYHISAQAIAAIVVAKKRGNRIIAVGTTVLRALEAAAAGGKLLPGGGETELFIKPGYRFLSPICCLVIFICPNRRCWFWFALLAVGFG